MAQDTTPAIVIYQGSGSNEFPIPFDKGYYGEVKVAFVRRGLTNYEYAPTTYTVSGAMYAWVYRGEVSDEYIYTKTPTPAVGTHTFDEHGTQSANDITAVAGQTITVGTVTYTRDAGGDFEQNAYLTWTGETLTSDDYICIVRETEMGQPYVFPANQKHIEDALDNIERQVQELKADSDRSVKVDTTITTPINWMNTVIRSTDMSVRGMKFANGFLSYSFDDPNMAEADKTWYNLITTSNVKNIYYEHTYSPEGNDLYNCYYEDLEGNLHLLTLDPENQDARISELEGRVDTVESNLVIEAAARADSDNEIRELITDVTFDPSELEEALRNQQQQLTLQGQTLQSHTQTLGAHTETLQQHTTSIGTNTSNITTISGKISSSVTAENQMMPKSYIDNKVTGIYHIQGVKETYSALPATGNVEGDCWMVTTSDGTHDVGSYVWVLNSSEAGGEWQFLGQTFDTTNFPTFDDLSSATGTINTRITNEVNTLNGTIDSEVNTLNDTIDQVEEDLTALINAKQHNLVAGTNMQIVSGVEHDTINMIGKFGKSMTMSGTNLILKDQSNATLSSVPLDLGIGVDATYNQEDISFATRDQSSYNNLNDTVASILQKIPDGTNNTNNKLVNQNQLAVKANTSDLKTVAFTGNYSDLTNKPTIGNATLTIQKNSSNVGTFTANATENKTINITVPTSASDVNALPNTTKYGSSLSLSINSSTYVMTAQLKDQDGNALGGAQTIDLPLESVVVNGSYDAQNEKIILTLQSGGTIEIPVGALISGLQSEITNENPLDADLVSDTSSTHKFVSASDKTTWNGKQDALVSGTNIKTINSQSILGEGNIDVDGLPDQSGQNGKFLTTNGESASWATMNALPDQSGQGGKYLKTDGSVASWSEIPEAEKYIAGDNITIAGALPDGYTLVEYIESDGTDHIDTGKKWDSHTVVVVKAKGINTTGGSRCIAGAVADGSGFQIVTELNRIGWQIGGAGYTHTSANVADEVRIDVPNHSAYFNGTLISDSYSPTTADINVYLFANNYGGSATSNSHVRVFRYTCYSRYNLPVIDLVPCKNSSNVYGFYDLESDTFFTCNGLTGGEAGRIISAKVPEVGDGFVYIKQGTANKGSFRMNQKNNTTITLDAVQIIQVSTMPTANADNLGKIVQWIGGGNTYTNGYFYECVSDGQSTPTYSWTRKDVQPASTSVTSVNSKTGDVVLTAADVSAVPQVSTMAAASADNVGKIVQWVGATDTYTNGYFYKCTATYTDATEIVRAASPQLVVYTNIDTFLQSGLDLNTPYLYKYNSGYWDCIDPEGITILGPRAGLVASGVINANDQVQVEVDVVYAWERVDVQPDAGVTATYDATTKTITFA